MAYKKIFVTGADGFIGSHLTEKLVKLGYNVKALAQYNSFNNYGWLDYLDKSTDGNFEKVLGDVRDQSNLNILSKDADVIFHLASLIGIPYSYIAPQSYIDTNVSGTLNILQAAKINDVNKIIHTSTSEVYGTAQFVPISENHPLNGQSPYAASKIAADQIAYSFYSSFDLPVAICRPFNTYGPRQSMRAIIPTIILQLLRGKDKVELGNIHTTRDFNYIEDTINGFISIMLCDKSHGEVFNIGSKFEIDIESTFKIISEIINPNAKITYDRHRIRPKKSEVERLFCDNSKALQFLDWKPHYNNKLKFSKGIKETINWYKNKENISNFKDIGYVI
jgi:NAD dependent epimerase/dehydratase